MDNSLIFDAKKRTSLGKLVNSIKIGHEIEFRIGEHHYFHQPHYNGETYGVPNVAPRYILWDEDFKKRIFEGTLEEELTFLFQDQYSFQDDFEKFSIDPF
ncbi:MAG: hypothetical protein IJW49_01050 [Clostridia bacterium]|nr:hypothetical protein [Clostridia bacterium]